MGAYDNSKRIFYYDVLRALAIVLVILSHTAKQFSYTRPIGSLSWSVAVSFQDLAVMGVPIFLMISGALLLNREYDLRDFLKRRFSRILIPFIFWAVLHPFLFMIFFNNPWTIGEYINIIVKDEYWFVWMLIGAYLLLPILNSFVKEYDIEGLGYLLILWFIFMIILKDLKIDFFTELVSAHSLGWTEIFAGYFGYIPLGYYLSVKKFRFSDKQMYQIGLALLIIFTIINIYYTLTKSPQVDTLVYYGYRRVVSTLQAVGLFLFIKYFSQYCEDNNENLKNKIYSLFKDTYLSTIILSVSVCSYGMYLTHYFILYPLSWITENVIPIYSLNPVFIPIVLLGITFLAWLIVFIFSKIPILKYFSGTN